MPIARSILPVLTSVMVLCNALLCLCGPAHTAAIRPAVVPTARHEPAEAASCCSHGAEARPDEHAGHGSGHGHGCDCLKSSVTEAKPVPAFQPADLPAILFAALPAWGEDAWGIVPAARETRERTPEARPAGSGDTLLRLHCALIL